MLTDKAVRAAGARVKAYKLTDSRGLHLHIAASGHKSWRVRRQNIWHNSRRRIAECGPRLRFDVRRRACGVASADVRVSFA